MNLPNATDSYRQRAHSLIPMGAQTYSRADDQFSANAPSFVTRALGSHYWDEHGREYIDYSMGLYTCTLGHADALVNEKVKQAIDKGTCYSRPSLLEGELAELLCSIIPCAEMVKFGKNGSDVTTGAIRLSRFCTRKKFVARCSQPTFHSIGDWFISSTSRPGGIPDEVGQWTLSFDFNNIASLKTLFEQHPDDIACVIMEPVMCEIPDTGFLQDVKDLCERHGTILIFDEIINGFRIDLKGAQHYFGVTPHLATFGKGISNGYPLSVLCGRADIMEFGARGGIFLLSSTFGGETIGLTAAAATIGYMMENPVQEYFHEYGGKLVNAFNECVHRYHLSDNLGISGLNARPEMRFSESGRSSFRIKTLFIQEMFRHNIQFERISLSFAHRDEDLQRTVNALDETFAVIADCVRNNTFSEAINGPLVKPVFP